VKLCDRSDFDDAEVLAAIQEIPPERDAREHIERKVWEFAMLALSLRDLGRLHEGTRMLAIGAGDERMAFWLANRVGQVVATDVYGEGDFVENEAQATMLEDPASLAPFPYREDHLEVRWMDARRLDFPDESFDVAYSLSSIEHFGSAREISQSAREMARVLRPGGHAIVVTDCFVRRSPLNSPLLACLIHVATLGRKLQGATPRNRGLDSVFTPRELQTRIVAPSGLRLLQPLDRRLTSATWSNVAEIHRGGHFDYGKSYWPHILLHHNRFTRPWVGRGASTFTSVCLITEKPGSPAA